jgi:hypothetical protein
MESKARGVLDTPHARGYDDLGCLKIESENPFGRAEPTGRAASAR